MKGRSGFFGLFASGTAEEETKSDALHRRRRHHSSGDRETWSRKVEYFFASLGYAVGMGNVWRFPYLCYRNGGGAFLIPYVLSLIAVGFPMLFMEMAFGQFASLGPITIWRICPLFKGIGYSVIVVLMLVNTYYNVLIAYSLFYLFASITSELPWARCDNKWNTDRCVDIERKYEYLANITEATNITVAANISVNGTAIDRISLKTPTEEFFERFVLKQTEGIDELGSIQLPLVVCLAVSWFVCFMCLFRGIKSMGKVVIFTTIFSYVILTVLFIRGVTLPGAADGIIYYLKPDFKKLANVQVWGEASAQAFASLSLGGGGWITLSSYNKFRNRCNRDAVMVGIGNALTSFYSGFVIFTVLGYMAYIKGVDVEHVTARGPGLAFVAYPEGLALIPGAPIWSLCFFFMMFTVGLDSLFGQVETIAAGIIDEYPDLLRPRRKIFTLVLCVVLFFIGIPLVSQGGIYIVSIMDWYTLLFSFSIISFFEIIVIIYIYGYKRFAEDIFMMVGSRPNIYYIACWLVVSPITLLCVIAFLAGQYKPPQYGDYVFPEYAQSIGWALALCPCALIPVTAVFMFFYQMGDFETFKKFFQDSDTRRLVLHRLIWPTEEWGPALPENFRRYSESHLKNGGHRASIGDEDVFGDEDVELKAVNPIDPEAPTEKDRLVHFQDEGRESDKGAEGDQGENKDEPAKEEETSKEAESENKEEKPETSEDNEKKDDGEGDTKA